MFTLMGNEDQIGNMSLEGFVAFAVGDVKNPRSEEFQNESGAVVSTPKEIVVYSQMGDKNVNYAAETMKSQLGSEYDVLGNVDGKFSTTAYVFHYDFFCCGKSL
ncbi:MAG: hypothetical protein ACI83O_000746 [Patescibacteria group bacterium]|jgi:hypothetical protein